MDKYNVIFHIDEQDKVGLVLHNISNLIVDLGEGNLNIEMVANGRRSEDVCKEYQCI